MVTQKRPGFRRGLSGNSIIPECRVLPGWCALGRGGCFPGKDPAFTSGLRFYFADNSKKGKRVNPFLLRYQTSLLGRSAARTAGRHCCSAVGTEKTASWGVAKTNRVGKLTSGCHWVMLSASPSLASQANPPPDWHSPQKYAGPLPWKALV